MSGVPPKALIGSIRPLEGHPHLYIQSPNYIPFPSQINPKTGKDYTQEEFYEYINEQREKQKIYHELWDKYKRLLDTTHNYKSNAITIHNNENSRRVKQYAQTLHDRNVKEFDTYIAEKWPDLILIKQDIDTRLQDGSISRFQANKEWKMKREWYMWNAVELEFSRRQFQRKLAALQQWTPRVVSTPVPSVGRSEWNTWMSQFPENPVLTGKPQSTSITLKPSRKSGSTLDAVKTLVSMKYMNPDNMNFDGGSRKKKLRNKTKRKQK